MDNKPVLDTNKFQKKPYFGIYIMLLLNIGIRGNSNE